MLHPHPAPPLPPLHPSNEGGPSSFELSHDNSNLEGFIDDSFWTAGAAEPTSLPSLEPSKTISILALVEKFEEKRRRGRGEEGDDQPQPPLTLEEFEGLEATSTVGGAVHPISSMVHPSPGMMMVHPATSRGGPDNERCIRDNLTYSYPQLLACLRGQWDRLDLEGLDKDIQELTISLQASAGMLTVMQHQHSRHHSSMLPVSGGEDCLPTSSNDTTGNETINNNVVFDDCSSNIMIEANDNGDINDRGSSENIILPNLVDKDTQCCESLLLMQDTSEGKESNTQQVVSNNEVDIGQKVTANLDEDISQNLDTTDDMTLLQRRTDAPVVEEEVSDRIMFLNSEITDVRSENHRLQGLCSGLQTEKKNLLDQLESMEKYSMVLSEQLQSSGGGESGGGGGGGGEMEEYSSGGGSSLQHKAQNLLKRRDQNTISAAGRVGELEAMLEALLLEHRQQKCTIAEHVQDLTKQLECADRQLRASRQFVEELTHEREVEVDQFTSDIVRLQNQLKDNKDKGDSNARLAQEICTLEGEVRRLMQISEDLSEQLAESKEQLKVAKAKISEMCSVLHNRDESDVASAAREEQLQAQLTRLRAATLHAEESAQAAKEEEESSVSAGTEAPEGGLRPLTTMDSLSESPPVATPRRHSLKEEILRQQQQEKVGQDQLDLSPEVLQLQDSSLQVSFLESLHQSKLSEVERRVLRVTRNLESVQVSLLQQQDIDDTSVSKLGESCDEDWYDGDTSTGTDSRCVSPGGVTSLLSLRGLDIKLEERLCAMEQVTQAAVKHTQDLGMTLHKTKAELDEVIEERETLCLKINKLKDQNVMTEATCEEKLLEREQHVLELQQREIGIKQLLAQHLDSIERLKEDLHQSQLKLQECKKAQAETEERERQNKMELENIKTRHVKEFDDSHKQLNNELDEAKKSLKTVGEMESSCRQELELRGQQLEQSQQELQQRRQELERCETLLTELKGQYSEELLEIHERVEQHKEQAQLTNASLKQRESALDQCKSELDQCRTDLLQRTTELSECKEELTEQDNISKEMELKYQKCSDERQDSKDKLVTCRLDLGRLQQELQDTGVERECLQSELAEQLRRVASLQTRLEENRRVETRQEVSELQARLRSTQVELEQAGNRCTGQQAEVSRG